MGFSLFTVVMSQAQKVYQTIGSIERLDPAINEIISSNAKAEIIAEGFDWSEGPVWVEHYKMLLFSDIPKNMIYKWTEAKGKEAYLTTSGYTGHTPRGGEAGSNGLTLNREGHLILCQHGDRQVARMDAPLDKPKPAFISLASSYKGKKFNSPNDVVVNSKGEVFFTDPPYGLLTQSDNDPAKELSWNGVYKIKTNGEIVLLLDSLTRPNGLAFLPTERQIIVANSDSLKPNWYIYDVAEDGLTNGRLFYSTTGYDKSEKGLPDGLKIDKQGNVFATGPGGVYVFNSGGKLLGRLRLPDAASNCAFSPDEKTLFITNDNKVLRFKMRD